VPRVLSAEYTIRMAALGDAATIVEHRREMFRDMGHRDEAKLAKMSAAFEPWLRRKMESGEYLAWMAVTADGSIVGGAGLWLMDWPPHVIGSGARRGNILNVYVRPQSRRRGIARALMETALEWTRANGVDCVILHASDAGRALYESLGFAATNEMRLTGRTAMESAGALGMRPL
jgi:ribosomal protein S18 acetylase RimI-like enzyme